MSFVNTRENEAFFKALCEWTKTTAVACWNSEVEGVSAQEEDLLKTLFETVLLFWRAEIWGEAEIKEWMEVALAGDYWPNGHPLASEEYEKIESEYGPFQERMYAIKAD